MKNPSRPSSALAVSATGKLLKGTAAQLRIIGQAGGWDQHIKSLMSGAANEAVENLWHKVLLNYTLTPYTEALSATQDAQPPASSGAVNTQFASDSAGASGGTTSNGHGKH